MGMLFDPTRIQPSEHQVPEIYCHGPRKMELLPGGCVRLWLCEDLPTKNHDGSAISIPVAKLLMPTDCYVWNVFACMEWAFDNGVLRRPPMGPAPLRPSRNVMQ